MNWLISSWLIINESKSAGYKVCVRLTFFDMNAEKNMAVSPATGEMLSLLAQHKYALQ
jgi:hypothetical protein